ncbi:hypothetical protein B0H16DRAFT_1858862 [Mycena metata]|uniref:Uncharacterized protein n=1 Tax=Mycena metata TaxID=1033252 RepID=A0AAD7K117_9AGAR|nr:hypothetical protein B0H16DRAFT_1858862 [Mycena metata]
MYVAAKEVNALVALPRAHPPQTGERREEPRQREEERSFVARTRTPPLPVLEYKQAQDGVRVGQGGFSEQRQGGFVWPGAQGITTEAEPEHDAVRERAPGAVGIGANGNVGNPFAFGAGAGAGAAGAAGGGVGEVWEEGKARPALRSCSAGLVMLMPRANVKKDPQISAPEARSARKIQLSQFLHAKWGQLRDREPGAGAKTHQYKARPPHDLPAGGGGWGFYGAKGFQECLFERIFSRCRSLQTRVAYSSEGRDWIEVMRSHFEAWRRLRGMSFDREPKETRLTDKRTTEADRARSGGVDEILVFGEAGKRPSQARANKRFRPEKEIIPKYQSGRSGKWLGKRWGYVKKARIEIPQHIQSH